MPLSDNIKEALLRNQGWLAEFVNLCFALENGNWQSIDKACAKFGLDMPETLSLYDESRIWAQERIEAFK